MKDALNNADSLSELKDIQRCRDKDSVPENVSGSTPGYNIGEGARYNRYTSSAKPTISDRWLLNVDTPMSSSFSRTIATD